MIATLAILGTLLAPADTARKIAFTGDVGLVNLSGNTTLTTVNLGDKLEFRQGAWGVTQLFSVVYGRNDSVTTTSLWNASVRGERSLRANIGLFVLGSFDRNTFAGVKARYSPQIGISARLLETPTQSLSLELGGGYTTLRALDALDNREFTNGRAAMQFKQQLGERSTLLQRVEYLPDFEIGAARRINSETALTAPIAGGISLKAAYQIRFDGRPAAGFRRTDRVLTTGLQVTF